MSETCPKCGAPRIEFVSSGPDRPAWTRFACCTTVWADGSVSATRTCAMRQLAAITAERDALKAKIDAARKYQDIVYAVCSELDRATGRSVRTGSGLVADKDEIVSALRSAILNDAREGGEG